MAQFAKIFNLQNGDQILVFTGYDVQRNIYFIVEKTEIDKIAAALVHEFNDGEKRDKTFAEYDEPRGKAFYFQMKLAIKEKEQKNEIEGTSFTNN